MLNIVIHKTYILNSTTVYSYMTQLTIDTMIKKLISFYFSCFNFPCLFDFMSSTIKNVHLVLKKPVKSNFVLS